MLKKLRTKVEEKDNKTEEELIFYRSAIHAYEVRTIPSVIITDNNTRIGNIIL